MFVLRINPLLRLTIFRFFIFYSFLSFICQTCFINEDSLIFRVSNKGESIIKKSISDNSTRTGSIIRKKWSATPTFIFFHLFIVGIFSTTSLSLWWINWLSFELVPIFWLDIFFMVLVEVADSIHHVHRAFYFFFQFQFNLTKFTIRVVMITSHTFIFWFRVIIQFFNKLNTVDEAKGNNGNDGKNNSHCYIANDCFCECGLFQLSIYQQEIYKLVFSVNDWTRWCVWLIIHLHYL